MGTNHVFHTGTNGGERSPTESAVGTARVFDTTLRDGEQSPGVSFSYDEKREIAALLDEMGTHVIEVGFPASSTAEFEAVRDIAESTTATTCAMARAVEDDIDAALETGVDMVLTFISTSDVQLENSMGISRAEAKSRAVDAVERLDDAGIDVMFGPMDATRTDEAYLASVVEAVAAAGADWIVVPDTCGVATPGRFAELVDGLAGRTDARIDVHTQDDFGLAVANALAGYRAGAAQAQVTVNGIGERGGNAAYEEVVMALESLYGVDTGIDTKRITELSDLVADASGIDVPPNKPVVGSNAFAHESGIHAAGVIENPETFEPGIMTPEMVGAERELVLGKHTGHHSVRERLREVGFDPSEDQVREATKLLKEYAAEHDQVTASDLERFARQVGVGEEGSERKPS